MSPEYRERCPSQASTRYLALQDIRTSIEQTTSPAGPVLWAGLAHWLNHPNEPLSIDTPPRFLKKFQYTAIICRFPLPSARHYISHSFSQWPLWKDPPVSNVHIGGLLTTKSTTKSNHQQNETHLVSSKVVEEHFSSKLPKDVMEIVLYVPKVPLLMVNRQGKESAALTINHNRLIILVQGPNATMQDSMSYLLPFFQTWPCWTEKGRY